MKYIIIQIIFSLFPLMAFCQNKTHERTAPQSSQKRHLTFQYFRIDRKQTGNGTAVQLNTNFNYLNIFDNSQRFAPDEPSSFSSLEYTFVKKNISQKIGYGIAAGIYRNHIKGDFILPGNTVHFGRGNSQVGLSASSDIWLQIFKKMDLSLSFQLGAGPQFTKLTAGANEVSTEGWGIKGWGISSNTGLWANSPVFFKRAAIGLGAVYNYTWSKYASFNVKNNITGNIEKYENVHFAAVSKGPKLTLAFKYYFYKINNADK
ncbi:MAG TPA: hypothetical protein ENJ95_14985 [Bacteroidetes bacterium]|nr:hypothetical protein [Bacteroidota bacterium]